MGCSSYVVRGRGNRPEVIQNLKESYQLIRLVALFFLCCAIETYRKIVLIKENSVLI